jgi:hypothetical protein
MFPFRVASTLTFVNQALADDMLTVSIDDEPTECKNGGLVSGEFVYVELHIIASIC